MEEEAGRAEHCSTLYSGESTFSRQPRSESTVFSPHHAPRVSMLPSFHSLPMCTKWPRRPVRVIGGFEGQERWWLLRHSQTTLERKIRRSSAWTTTTHAVRASCSTILGAKKRCKKVALLSAYLRDAELPFPHSLFRDFKENHLPATFFLQFYSVVSEEVYFASG